MRFLNLGAARLTTVTLWTVMLFSPAAQAQTGSTLKVLDWNTHHGVGSDAVYNLQRFVTWIARSGAQVVSLNEVEKFTSWGNEDQPARYAALLKAATGKTWYYTFAQRDGATNGQGNLILSTIPFEATGSETLSYARSVARAQIVVNGVRVNLFSTHLDADSSARRAQQMAELKSWASGFSQQHIFAGDFNAWPGAAEIANMTAVAHDAWATAKASGTATAYAGNEAGNTRNSRIDYIWYSKNATRLVLKGAQVFDTRDGNGTMPSDHRPVMATFQVGTATGSATTPTRLKAAADFDGDLKADPTVYRPATGEWFSLRSSGAALQVAWGVPSLGDIPVVGDFDGDGRADAAVFRPTDGTWQLRSSKTGASSAIQWGNRADRPVPGDYDGDGRTDVAVFRPADGVWYVRYSGTGATTGIQWGNSADVPVPGDYDGDGKTDTAVFRPANGTWYVRHSSTGQTVGFRWGNGDDVTVPGDYDGDGRTDGAVFRPASGTWYIRYSSNGGTAGFQWGNAVDRPVAADYDGDGRTDLAVFRPSNGVWYLRYSSTGASGGTQWGNSADRPILSR
jgi:endonuclease/exonuclease/phosphatase family metal-dependent hydrolase